MFVLGVAVVRGSPTVVIDGHRLLGGHERPGGRMLVLKAGSQNFGFTVDSISGVAEIEESDQDQELAPLLPHITSDWIERLVKLDSSFALVLAAGRIVPEAVWESLRNVGHRG
jgi:chemotaxis signal transduction protein